MDPVAMISAGLLDDFDSLTGLVGSKLAEVDGKTVPTAEAIQALAGMSDKLLAGMDMVDRLVEAAVVEPKVVWPVHRDGDGKPLRNRDGTWMRLGPDERDDETLYTDDVDLEDRMYIMQWAVGGIKDPEQFRIEYAGVLESVENGSGLPLSAFGSPFNN
jgi:hypothetical protein